MKNGKKPTLRQKQIMKASGLVPADWLVVKDLGSELHVVSRVSLKRIGSKPRIRVLEVEGK